MAKRSWLLGVIYLAISFVLLALPTFIYIYNHEDTFFITGYLGTRELYTIDTVEIQQRLSVDYPDAENNDFVRIIDTDSDWDFKIDEVTGVGEWTDYKLMHAYLSTNDILLSFVIALIILALVLLKALRNIDKMIAFPIWAFMIGFMLLFLKGILVYLPQLLFSVAGGWILFYVFFKLAKRKFHIWNEYRDEKVRVQARSES